jgi:hypothetical protein
MPSITPWRSELRGQVRDLFGSLGNDASGVARRLEEAGVRGTPRDSGDCAIAVYLSAVVCTDPAVRALKVTADRVIVTRASRWRPPITVSLPVPLRSFVASFDRDCYPQLTRTPQDGSTRTQQTTPQSSA